VEGLDEGITKAKDGDGKRRGIRDISNNLADKRATPPLSYYYCLADTVPLDNHINTHTSITTKIKTHDRIKRRQREPQ
jgi:hypothetical protein